MHESELADPYMTPRHLPIRHSKWLIASVVIIIILAIILMTVAAALLVGWYSISSRQVEIQRFPAVESDVRVELSRIPEFPSSMPGNAPAAEAQP